MCMSASQFLFHGQYFCNFVTGILLQDIRFPYFINSIEFLCILESNAGLSNYNFIKKVLN